MLRTHGLVDTQIMLVASLVMGRSFNLTSVSQKHYYDFIKTVISSDMDCDKIDYVARDAFFTGIPIAADMDRLISQLDTTEMDMPNGDAQVPERPTVVGVLPSGVASVEMFILTRSYLFDRIYQHPKVRAAERLLERALLKRISRKDDRDREDPDFGDIASVLYGLAGDDACLSDRCREDSSHCVFLTRRLPRRALALSLRFCIGYSVTKGLPSQTLRRNWQRAHEQLVQNAQFFENKIK